VPRRMRLRAAAEPGNWPPTMALDPLSVRAELLAMAAEDLNVREELARSGELFEGYHPRMREIHDRNAARLGAIMEAHGWPGRSFVGEDASEAAWLVLQHAISNPALQRRGLALIRKAAATGDASAIHVAMLEDRIRSNEGKGQLYGTQFDWDENNQISPVPIEDEPNVDKRRAEIGLAPLAEEVRRKRQLAVESGLRPPKNWKARQAEIREWLRSTAWRE
jgi:hypothetical protein